MKLNTSNSFTTGNHPRILQESALNPNDVDNPNFYSVNAGFTDEDKHHFASLEDYPEFPDLSSNDSATIVITRVDAESFLGICRFLRTPLWEQVQATLDIHQIHLKCNSYNPSESQCTTKLAAFLEGFNSLAKKQGLNYIQESTEFITTKIINLLQYNLEVFIKEGRNTYNNHKRSLL